MHVQWQRWPRISGAIVRCLESKVNEKSSKHEFSLRITGPIRVLRTADLARVLDGASLRKCGRISETSYTQKEKKPRRRRKKSKCQSTTIDMADSPSIAKTVHCLGAMESLTKAHIACSMSQSPRPALTNAQLQIHSRLSPPLPYLRRPLPPCGRRLQRPPTPTPPRAKPQASSVISSSSGSRRAACALGLRGGALGFARIPRLST